MTNNIEIATDILPVKAVPPFRVLRIVHLIGFVINHVCQFYVSDQKMKKTKQNKRDRQFLNCGVRSEKTKKKQEQEPSCTVVTKRVWLHTTILVKHEVNKTKQE